MEAAAKAEADKKAAAKAKAKPAAAAAPAQKVGTCSQLPPSVFLDCVLMSRESASRHLHKHVCLASVVDVICHSRILVYRSRHVDSSFFCVEN